MRVDKYSDLVKLLNPCKRIAIVGIAGTGKTTLSIQLGESLNLPVIHSDRYLGLSYKEQLYALIDELEITPSWIVEGVQCYRLLRKKPELVDSIVHMGTEKFIPPQSLVIAKGLHKIWKEYLWKTKAIRPPIYEYDFGS